MEFYLLGLLVSVIGVLPLLLTRKIATAFAVAVAGLLVLGTIFYLAVPFTVWPWWGAYGIFTAIMLLVSSVLAVDWTEGSRDQGLKSLPLLLTLCLLVVMMLSPMSGCDMFRSSEYAGLIGPVETRVWTQDVQPKDPRHIRMVSKENANFLAKQSFGQVGAIGSQFEIMEESTTPQFIGDKFKVIVPVDFRGFWAWYYTGTIPGYVVVNGEDPTAEATFVQLPQEKQFRYSPNACFEFNLERHIWRQGYRNYGITSYTLEVDDKNVPWWTVTLYKPACFAWGEKFAGILLVNPVTGECIMHEVGKIPNWVDLAVPAEFVKNWVDSRGLYSISFWNAIFAGQGLTKPEDPVMVYGANGEPLWVTGITSRNDKDTSLIGLYYTDTRTGKSVFYKAEGSTDAAILNAIAKNQDVQFRKLHGTVPQIYNIRGTMASVVPLLNENHIFQGVAIVDVRNVQLMGVGADQHEALRNYERKMPLSGHQIAPDLSRAVMRLQGVVQRIMLVPQGTEPIFYIYLKDTPHIFTGGVQLSPKLALTKEGDTVAIEYYSSGQSIEPLHGFDNGAIRLEVTSQEKQVLQAAAATRKEVEQRASAKNSGFDLEKLSEEQLRQLQAELLQRQKK